MFGVPETSDPVLLFLGVFVSLVFFLLGISLVFFDCFLIIFQDFKGSQGEENPWCFFFLRFSLVPSKRPRKRRTGEFTKPPGSHEFCGFSFRKTMQERASKFGSILGRDRGLGSAAAGRAPNWTGGALNSS